MAGPSPFLPPSPALRLWKAAVSLVIIKGILIKKKKFLYFTDSETFSISFLNLFESEKQ